MTRALRRWAAAVVLVLIVTGCNDNSRGFMETRQQQEAELASRPTSEERVAELTQARDAVRDRLRAELGLSNWSETDIAGRSGCSEFSSSRGNSVSVPALLLTGGVPDAQWDRAAGLVGEVMAAYNFGPVEVVVDNPGEHEIVVHGEWGALLRFGTLANATLALGTGCHLPAGVAASPPSS